jgi:hypothetical protein
MPQQKRSKPRGSKKAFVIGRDAFAQISAVEGITLKPEMNKRAAKARREGLSPEEYRREIVRAHRNG